MSRGPARGMREVERQGKGGSGGGEAAVAREGPGGVCRARWWGEGSRICIKPHVPFVNPGPPPQLSQSSSLSLWRAVPLPPTQTLALLCYGLSLSKACSSPSTVVLALTFRPTISESSSWAFLGGRRPADTDRPNAPCLATGGLPGSSSPSPRSHFRLPALEFWSPAGSRVLLSPRSHVSCPPQPPEPRVSGGHLPAN